MSTKPCKSTTHNGWIRSVNASMLKHDFKKLFEHSPKLPSKIHQRYIISKDASMLFGISLSIASKDFVCLFSLKISHMEAFVYPTNGSYQMTVA